jgi:glycosyltransferase involved in cell wall biosynthesis
VKILHVDPAPTWRGGERQVHLLASHLERRGVRNTLVAAPGAPLAVRAAESGLRVRTCRMRGDADVFAVWRLGAMLRSERPDVVHLHTARAHAVVGLAARLAGFRPVVVTRRLELPVRGAAGRWKYRALADHYVAISDAVAASLRAAGVPARRISLVPSGVEIPPESRPPAAGTGFVVGTLAAMTAQKDPDTWVRAAARAARADPGIRFAWAGEGELRPRLEGAIRATGVADRLELLPFQEDPEPFWRRLSAFFLPSAFEALGTVLLDAMARGLPVVATRVGGIPEVVRDGCEGLLARPGDDVALSAAILRLRAEPALAGRLGAAGRARAGEFEIGGVVDRIVALYETLLRERGT